MVEPVPQIKIDIELISKMQDPLVSGLLRNINREYLYWDKVKYKNQEGLSSFELWSIVKISRKLYYSTQKFGKYEFRYFSTEFIQEMLHYCDMNIGGNMGGSGFVPEQDKARYMISSIMEEAISSSKIEGANTTRKKAKEMLLKETKPKDRSEQMIFNNYHTIDYISNNYTKDLTVDQLLYIHKLITENTLDNHDEEGCFRRNNDIFVVNTSTSETVHTPPSHDEIPELLKDVCHFFNEEDVFIHPIIKGIIIHFMIAWIHPFSDGNGRTARSLFYWYLLKKGYWLVEYLSISRIIQHSKNQYERAYLYTENDENDLNYFITYNLKAMAKAFDTLREYISRKEKEANLTARFVRIPGVNERQAFLLKKICDEPDIVFTVKEVENRFAISSFTARSDLNNLVKMGFLSEIQVNKIKRDFVKSDEFDRLTNKYK